MTGALLISRGDKNTNYLSIKKDVHLYTLSLFLYTYKSVFPIEDIYIYLIKTKKENKSKTSLKPRCLT